jgi:hypothetical protein
MANGIIPQPVPTQPIKVNLEDLESIQCEGCNGKDFDLIWNIRKVPAMLSKSGKISLFPVAYFRCTSCLKVTKIIHQG